MDEIEFERTVHAWTVGEDEEKLQIKDGLYQGQRPDRRALIRKTSLRIMLAMSSRPAGGRARRKTSQTSKPVTSLLLAPRRWHTEAVAVQKLAARASWIAFSISPLRAGSPSR